MNKLGRSLKGLGLMLLNLKTFYPEKKFLNKRIAIVGPADSAYEEEKEDYINGFDYVIRINKALSTWNTKNERFIGSRTDIWFHSFYENTESGGGPLNKEIISSRQVGMLVNPRTSFKSYKRTWLFFKKRQLNMKVYHLNSSVYNDLIKNFPTGLHPTVGFVALYTALISACSELYITGFTFFKTPYAKGYRDHLIDLEENKEHFKKQGIHDADYEYELFKKFLNESNCKSVKTDNKLKAILASD